MRMNVKTNPTHPQDESRGNTQIKINMWPFKYGQI